MPGNDGRPPVAVVPRRTASWRWRHDAPSVRAPRRTRARGALSAWNSSTGMNTSPRTSTMSGWPSPASFSGMPVTRRALSVTSSPMRPSPRVAAEVRIPRSYRRLIARPSILSSVSQRTSRPAAATVFSHHATSSSAEKTLSRLSMRSACVIVSRPVFSADPTVCVGESCARSTGCAASISSSRCIHASYVGSSTRDRSDP